MPTEEQMWESFYGHNLGYIQEQYEIYLQNPEAVAQEYRDLFATRGAPPLEETRMAAGAAVTAGPLNAQQLKHAVAAGKLVWNIRAYGHLAANIDPLDIGPKADARVLEPETYGLKPADLAALPADLVWEGAPGGVRDGWAAIQKLRDTYTGTIAFEFGHVHDEDERKWLSDYAEQFIPAQKLGGDERRKLVKRLLEAEQFEDFLQKTFVGAKRFSVEGNDVLVALVDEIVHELSNAGVGHITMGMAHRGRLNVLAHVLEKPYSKIFSEFHHSTNKSVTPSEGSIGMNYGWSGDVKYHLGANRSIKTGETVETRLTLANNPSHLEYVNPVVQGFARAAQEDRSKPGYPVRNEDAAASIVIHGDAAFPGEGIVAETLNIGQLPGYRIGGTIHIIANNKIGFTTESHDSRSTHYSSDPAKGYEIPIVHVNADDPEACIMAARMASEYRRLFKKDFLIDLIGYRRYGHNETDDPESTQPLIYKKVKAHPTVSRIYADKLISQGVFAEEEYARIKKAVVDRLKAAYEEMKQREGQEAVHQTPPSSGEAKAAPTGVSLTKLRAINKDLLHWPEGFTVYPKLQKILERRAASLNKGEKVDWGHAETLAFATILAEGTPIRITGQDAERATFAFRNLVLHDPETGALYCPLHKLPQAKASFAIHNSALSESAILGFEYGYNVFAPNTMVIWEAQYGDFANVAQVLIDQFVSSGRSKWSERSGLVMLLPHGYEGAGPEHSSARLERYLQLSAEENWTVANVTSSAQYFHLLRRQASILGTDDARPLVLMTPKSLVRNPRAASSPEEFEKGSFRTIIEQTGLGGKPERVERLALCTGKVAIDLEDAIDKEKSGDFDWLHVVRVEQLYPFPAQEIAAVLARFPNLKEIVWVQEEPRNMGSWSFIEPRVREIAPSGVSVRYVGRPDRSSPATGFAQVHALEQQFIVSQTLKPSPTLTHNLGR
ncbi:2-oxoglutarate dehydrogenase E1 component [Cohnella lubricantis]|uniref:2-oxoglutarate dehydrogenase E1 component n=1 Tax=Cohnella lubricantis TaxID=2163172 RepID=A0A841TGD9_9BACL|nr:2-oxoglutarate dehydrogenase E1 component [Cohnella lubricantis]MBB6678328.1 2-oxoglutarate dehydrogenase E1 component [Cohnella lubricantis]MBP2118531.1 2-oxoglutarate dehydrogenase E1 component [Cohnella lubricantis]